MTTPLVIKRASRKAVPLKIALTGPANSGKTETALRLAYELHGPDAKVLVGDTEAESASLYADDYPFDTVDMTPPFTTKKFLELLAIAEANKYNVLIIDSLSHAWDGDGGILDRKAQEELRATSKNAGFALWNKYKGEWRELIGAILQSRIDIIACMRVKSEHAQVEKDGKKSIEKLGLAPIVGEGADYEFSFVFDIQANHFATCSKDRSKLFKPTDIAETRYFDLFKDQVGVQLRDWRASGGELTPIARDDDRWFVSTSQWDGTIDDALEVEVKPGVTVGSLPVREVYSLLERVDGKKLKPDARRIADALNARSKHESEKRNSGASFTDADGESQVSGAGEDANPATTTNETRGSTTSASSTTDADSGESFESASQVTTDEAMARIAADVPGESEDDFVARLKTEGEQPPAKTNGAGTLPPQLRLTVEEAGNIKVKRGKEVFALKDLDDETLTLVRDSASKQNKRELLEAATVLIEDRLAREARDDAGAAANATQEALL